MNKSKARNLAIEDIPDFLPIWFKNNIDITFRIVTTNTYMDFSSVRDFICASIAHLTPEKDDQFVIKHAHADVEDKGTKDGFIYITATMYAITEDGIWKIVKSCKAKLREKMRR